ncbi:sugar transferase [Cohnella endophytica]|uniref:Sugar transferase n=1 Tax=Cohnella endophytica TaxID=2419778 RepID=A0A494XTB2_9BACL|nr:sugar transferase [Cohnella endophytica]RKP53840.1 sugar transferase [Cohnella endophytica]
MSPRYRDEAVLDVSEYYSKAGIEQIDRREFSLHGVLKRAIDIVGSLFGLMLLSPLFVVIAIAIKWEEPKGSVFFSQTRIGKDEKPFRIYKFRSMCVDAEAKLKDVMDRNFISGAMFKIKDDPRITRIGKFIRKTSIDELPQFINVLKGDMSLVGPRPSSPMEVSQYTKYDKQRLSVTPGCTGLWQVSGRNNIGFKEMVELDLSYIKKKSIWFDIGILFRTVVTVLTSKGAS